MREIVIDTETTGLDPRAGHRIVEIACVELIHHVPTGKTLHAYVNPERDMPEEAFAVHGLTAEFLGAHPTFAAIVDELVAFIAGDPVVIHNAEFDLGFLEAEFARVGRPPLKTACVDTLVLARRRFPGASASLDALCRRFAIDLSARERHGAEIDCALLAAVYLELLGGRQPGLDFAASVAAGNSAPQIERVARPPRPHLPTAAELAAHQAMLASLVNPLWLEPR